MLAAVLLQDRDHLIERQSGRVDHPRIGRRHHRGDNSGSVTGKIISRVGPILGIPPRFEFPPTPFPLLAKLGYGMANVPAMKGQEED